MTRFRFERPNQEVRLRKWGAGRVSQLRLLIGHFQQAIGVSLAAQVAQSPKRKFSEFVPKIVPQDITVDVDFREIRVKFTPPRGLKDFLFYEAHLGTTENFFSFDLFTSPDPSFVFVNIEDGVEYFFRFRVVTNRGLVGPWSDTESAFTPIAQAFSVFDGTIRNDLLLANTATFTEIFTKDYAAIGGKAYYSLMYEILVPAASPNFTNNLEWTDVEFIWKVDGVQVGRNFLVTAYSTNNATAAGIGKDLVTNDGLTLPGRFTTKRRGTFVQKFTELDAGDHTISMEARTQVSSQPTPGGFDFDDGSTLPIYHQRAIITTKNFCLFEALVN